MFGRKNGGNRHVALGESVEVPPPTLSDEWRDYFRNWIRPARFPGPQQFLRDDIIATIGRTIDRDARVLEVGVGAGGLLASLPNVSKTGVDVLPEALRSARALDPSLTLHRDDALTMDLGEEFDAIICDRLCHTIPDVQQLLANLEQHLAPGGRIFLTVFNFIWSLPVRLGSKVGFTEPSPPQNWLSASDLENLFALTQLESIRFEDRILLPAPVPLLDPLLNRLVARLPMSRAVTLYRLYSLRRREEPKPPAKVTVVIPARNEAGNIRAAIERTPVMGTGTEVVFVEGGSTDDTRAVIQREIASYRGGLELAFVAQSGDGKGDAVRAGFAHATGELLMILDADLTVSPEELPKFYHAMCSGMTDYIQGTRLVYPMEDDAMRFLNKLGNTFFAQTFSYLLDQRMNDTLCGTKVLWKRDYERLARNRSYFGEFDPFGDFDLIFGARKLNLKMMELPVRYRNRTYGTTNISRFRHGLMLLRMSVFAARKLKFF